PPPPRCTLFPSTTLFRSHRLLDVVQAVAQVAADRENNAVLDQHVAAGGGAVGHAVGRCHWRLLLIFTATSVKGCGTGALGLWTVISTSLTVACSRHIVASRSASVSIRLTGSPSITATSLPASSP